MTLSERIKEHETNAFRASLLERAIHGETITAGTYYLYLSQYAIAERKVSKQDAKIVAAELAKREITQ